MITNENKKRILEAIATNRTNYPSDAKHAASLGISTSVYSAIKNGQTDKALSEANWITIARRLDRKSTRLNSSHSGESRMPSSA